MSTPAKITRLVFTIVSLSMGAIVFADEPGDQVARDLWMSGFLKYKEATVAEQAQNAPLALRLYQEAARQFRTVQRDYPNWEKAVVAFRLTQCNNRIKVLQTQLVEKRNDLSAEELATLNQTLQARIAELEEREAQAVEQVELLKARIAGLQNTKSEASQDELEALRAENQMLREEALTKGSKSAVRKLKNQVKDLEEQCGALSEQLGAAVAEARKNAKLKDEIDALKGIAVELEANLAKMAESKIQLREELTSVLAERQRMAEQLSALSGKLEDLQKTSEALRKQNEALRKQL